MKTNLPAPNLKFFPPDARNKLEDVLKSAEHIQENLPDFQNFLQTGNFWIEKCFISANTLQQERFSKDKVYIQRSPAITTLFDEKSQSALVNTDVIYIAGPTGMGKSYAILFYVMTLRKKNYPVLYINNPADLIENPVPYLVREIIYAISGELSSNLEDFYAAIWEGKENENPREVILNFFSRIENFRGLEGLLWIIKRLQAFYSQTGRSFILIFDQYTRYEELRERNPVQRKTIDTVISCFTKKIYGRSILQPRGSSMSKDEIVLGSSFDKEETYAYLSNRLSKQSALGQLILSGDPEDATEALSRIREATKCIPYELEVIVRTALKSPNDPLEEIVAKYCYARVRDIQQIHINWANKLSVLEGNRINQFIFILDNFLAQGRESLENLISRPDPNLIYYDEKTSQWCYISELVKDAVYQYYRSTIDYQQFLNGSLSQYIKDIVQIMLTEGTPARTKGNLFERLVEYSMRIAIHRQENYKITYHSTTNQDTLIDLPLGNTRMKQFTTGKDLEDRILEFLRAKDIGILFSTDPNLPYVDFIIIDARNEQARRIYLLQATVNVKNHEKSDIFYQNEIAKLVLGKEKACELISKVMFKITKTNHYVETIFIWISGDDIWSKGNVDPVDLLKTKHKDSGIAFTRDNFHLSRFFS